MQFSFFKRTSFVGHTQALSPAAWKPAVEPHCGSSRQTLNKNLAVLFPKRELINIWSLEITL